MGNGSLPSESIIATSEGFSALVDLSYDEINNRHQKASENFDRLPLPIEQVFIEKQCTKTFASRDNALTWQIVKQGIGVRKKQRKIKLDLLISHELKPNPVEDWQDFLSSDKKLCITNDELSEGLLTQDIAVITEVNLFGADVVKQQRRRRAKHKDFDEAIKSLVEIQIGDPIVHESYGVGRYLGLKTQTFDGLTQDFLMLEYAKGSKLMVPMTSLNLISRYSGASPESAPLHKLGTNQWTKAKQKAHEALYDVAAELLEIYAKRQSQRGFAFPAPSDAYGSFVASFPFEETPDQLKTMGEVLADMQSHKPMDRLVCGDVGFGKTEIAMRAAFLAVESGKQVAILVPTTLLANQHYASFQDRFINHPVEIKALSRKSKAPLRLAFGIDF
jgi:transcription-repair coupling factor (superfamily II helicase)